MAKKKQETQKQEQKKSVKEMTRKEMCETVFWDRKPRVPKGFAVFNASSSWVRETVGLDAWAKSIEKKMHGTYNNKTYHYDGQHDAYRVRRIPKNGMKVGEVIKILPKQQPSEEKGKPLSFREQYLLRKMQEASGRDCDDCGSDDDVIIRRSLEWGSRDPQTQNETRAYARALAERLNGVVNARPGDWRASIVRKKTNDELREEIEDKLESLKSEVKFEKFLRDPKNREKIASYGALAELIEKKFHNIGFDEDEARLVEAIVDIEGKTEKEIERLLLIDSI